MDDIYDYGLLHQGADMVILDHAAHAQEKVLKEQLLPGGLLAEISDNEIKLTVNGEEETIALAEGDDVPSKLVEAVGSYLEELTTKY